MDPPICDEKQVRQINGQLRQFQRYHTFLLVSIWWTCCHISFSSYIVRVELWHLTQRTGLQLWGAPEPPCGIQISCFLSTEGAPDTWIAKEFGIFTESILLKDLQSIAHENRCQLLDSPDPELSQYISNHPQIERLSKPYRFDVSYPKTRLWYSRLTQSILPSISSLSNEIQAHLRFTILSSVIIPDLTPHTYSIQRLISTCRHS